jgi:hypothetical protein
MNSKHAPPAQTNSGPGPEPGYETTDASAVSLLSFGVGLIVALVVVELVILGFYRLFMSERPRPRVERAESNIYEQLRDLRRDEDTKLSSYGWADRKAGVVQIPIDRAIDLVAEQGIRFGKGPKTEIEMNSHSATSVSLPVPGAEKDATNPPERTGPRP